MSGIVAATQVVTEARSARARAEHNSALPVPNLPNGMDL